MTWHTLVQYVWRCGWRKPIDTEGATLPSLLGVAAVAILLAACSPDLVTSSTTREKAQLLKQDALFKSSLGGIAPSGIAIVNAGSAGEGPGDWSTTADRNWESNTFGLDPTTVRTVAGYLAARGVQGIRVGCYPTLWSIGGFKQYGPWVGLITAFVASGRVQVHAELGIGDELRGTVSDAIRQRNTAAARHPLAGSRCARSVQRAAVS